MPTLARLSFWVSPERMDTFETVYKKKLVPVLKKHGLEESSERGRKTVEGVFSRLFEVETPSEVAVKEIALRNDPAWKEVLRTLGITFRTTEPDGLIGYRFGVYSSPAGSGTSVKAGVGTRQGVWQSFDVSDGLPTPITNDILQDREGNLWFANGIGGGGLGGGVCRYDGEEFVTLTPQDGLVNNWTFSLLEDREGRLWVGTRDGVSRYDGEEFLTFTTEDGLAHNSVSSILEDREGHLWFGTGRYGTEGGGVSRYDGEEFLTLTPQDGLVGHIVRSILEDREGHLWFGTEGGVSRYDRGHFTPQDGLLGSDVCSILEDREGVLWFGTDGSVSRYDPSTGSGGPGEHFVAFTTERGLARPYRAGHP